jgi:hypothetical protein
MANSRIHPETEGELLAASKLFRAFRHVIIRGFPYMLVYKEDPNNQNDIQLLAFVNALRDPKTLKATLVHRAEEI